MLNEGILGLEEVTEGELVVSTHILQSLDGGNTAEGEDVMSIGDS